MYDGGMAVGKKGREEEYLAGDNRGCGEERWLTQLLCALAFKKSAQKAVPAL